jgi:outer membrane protein OmpA-like peptidoglycan-associated protein
MAEPLPRPAEGRADALDRLKSLLSRGESARLTAVETTLAALDRRLGDASGLEAATADILVEALRRADAARRAELARAATPLVVEAIRAEAVNAPNAIVEALRPAAGPLARAAATNGVRATLAAVEDRLEALTSPGRWRARARAPEAALVAGPTRAWLLERGAGALLASWRAEGRPTDKTGPDDDVMAALTGFARAALGDDRGGARALDIGGRHIHASVSPTRVVACEFGARPAAGAREALDRETRAWLEQDGRGGAVDDAAFRAFMERARDRSASSKRTGTGWRWKIAASALALAAAALVARAGVRDWRERDLRAALAEAIERSPALAGFPLAIDVDHEAQRVELRGLAPSSNEVEAVTARLRGAAGGYRVEREVAVVAPAAAVAADVASARTEARSAAAALASRYEAVEGGAAKTDQLAATARELEAARAEQAATADLLRQTNERLAAAEARLDELAARLDAPRARREASREKLAAAIDGLAVYFDGAKPVLPPDLGPRLDALAAVLRESGLSIGLVGYANDTANAAKSRAVASQRAEAVARLLVERGVDPDKIAAAGRVGAEPARTATRETLERNRRVVFEAPKDGEAAAP